MVAPISTLSDSYVSGCAGRGERGADWIEAGVRRTSGYIIDSVEGGSGDYLSAALFKQLLRLRVHRCADLRCHHGVCTPPARRVLGAGSWILFRDLSMGSEASRTT